MKPERGFIPAVALLLVFGSTAFAQVASSIASSSPKEAVADEEFRLPVGKKLHHEIAELTARLGAPSFAARKFATDRLIEIGAPALSQLRDAYADTSELEIRLRIERIVHTSFLNYHVYDRNGFLGVSLLPSALSRNLPPKVADGAPAVVVQSVIRDTAAAAAGLKRNDVILAVDGQLLSGSQSVLVPRFARMIRKHRPGTVMRLTLIRGGNELEVEVTLGRCTEEQIRNGNISAIPTLLRKADERFPIWWAEHFGRVTVEPSGDHTP